MFAFLFDWCCQCFHGYRQHELVLQCPLVPSVHPRCSVSETVLHTKTISLHLSVLTILARNVNPLTISCTVELPVLFRLSVALLPA